MLKKTKQICESPLPSPSQDRDLEVSGLYEITVEWLRTQVGNPYIDTLAHGDTQIDTDTQLKQSTNIHRFICRRGFGYCFLCFLSVCRRIFAVVRVQIQIPISPEPEPCLT